MLIRCGKTSWSFFVCGSGLRAYLKILLFIYLFKFVYLFITFCVCSSGAIPEISKVTPEKAGALFVAGYNGDDFQPGYQAGPGSVDPVELGKGFTAMVHLFIWTDCRFCL